MVDVKVYKNGRYHCRYMDANGFDVTAMADYDKNASYKVVANHQTVARVQPQSHLFEPRTLARATTSTGYLSAYVTYQIWRIETEAKVLNVRMTGSGDFDLYANWDHAQEWRFQAATNGHEENLRVPNTAGGRRELFLLVWRYTGEGPYTLQWEAPTVVAWPSSARRALICGISDYLNISDLSYCDEDVTDWLRFFTNQGYTCRVLGDSHPENFPRYDGLATKANMRAATRSLTAGMGAATDRVAFVSSGHGAGDGAGASHLCTYAGQRYHDYELRDDLGPGQAGKIVILDHCFSGGFDKEMAAVPHCFFAAACTQSGYGYDVGQFQNGKFSYAWFKAFQAYGDACSFLIYQEAILGQYATAQPADRPVFVHQGPAGFA